MAEPELGLPFCGLSESALRDVGEMCRWRHVPVSLSHVMDLPAARIGPDQISRVFAQVAASWTACCGIDLKFQPDPNANILAVVAPLDGPNGVLGDSYLPCGNVSARTQLGQRYDSGEIWTIDFLTGVVLHEVGHALGLPHAPRGSGAVMEPFLTAHRVPQPWDVEQMQARYGPPIVGPPVPPPPLPPPPPPLPPSLPPPSTVIPLSIGESSGSQVYVPPEPVAFRLDVSARGSYVVRVTGAGTWVTGLFDLAQPGLPIAVGGRKLGVPLKKGAYLLKVARAVRKFSGTFRVLIERAR